MVEVRHSAAGPLNAGKLASESDSEAAEERKCVEFGWVHRHQKVSPQRPLPITSREASASEPPSPAGAQELEQEDDEVVAPHHAE